MPTNKHRINKYKTRFCLLLTMVTLLLSACGDNKYVKDLRNHIDELKKAATTSKKPDDLTKLQAPQSVVYQPKSMRSPFETSAPAGRAAITHPLQAFPLSVLRFKGTLTQNDNIWAFIMAPDNKLYQVKLGDMIGDHYGKIIKIYPDRIEIQEHLEDSSGIAMHTTQRIVTLQLKDGQT